MCPAPLPARARSRPPASASNLGGSSTPGRLVASTWAEMARAQPAAELGANGRPAGAGANSSRVSCGAPAPGAGETLAPRTAIRGSSVRAAHPGAACSPTGACRLQRELLSTKAAAAADQDNWLGFASGSWAAYRFELNARIDINRRG